MRDKKALAERLFSAAGLAVGGGILAYLLWYVRCGVDLGRVLGRCGRAGCWPPRPACPCAS